MNAIDKIYAGYNFSATRCYVIPLSVNINGYMKIEHKLPAYVQNLKGIFVSVSCKTSAGRNAGFLFLSFNGNTLKNIQLPIIRTNLLLDCSHPLPLDEIIQPNSFVQGFYYDTTNGASGYPYTLSIYLHYEPTAENKK